MLPYSKTQSSTLKFDEYKTQNPLKHAKTKPSPSKLDESKTQKPRTHTSKLTQNDRTAPHSNSKSIMFTTKPKTSRNSSTSISQLQVQDGSPSTMPSKETNPVYHRAEGDNTRPNKFTKLRKHIEKIKQHLKTKDKGINIHDADKVAYTSYLTPSKNTKVSSSRYNDAIWDTGATHGIHWNTGYFTNLHTPVITQIRGITGSSVTVRKAGTCQGMRNVLLMPSCGQPIISISQFLDQHGGKLETSNKTMHWVKEGKRILVAKRNKRGLYSTCMKSKAVRKLARDTAEINLSIRTQLLREKIQDFHRRLGHVEK